MLHDICYLIIELCVPHNVVHNILNCGHFVCRPLHRDKRLYLGGHGLHCIAYATVARRTLTCAYHGPLTICNVTHVERP